MLMHWGSVQVTCNEITKYGIEPSSCCRVISVRLETLYSLQRFDVVSR